MRYLPLFLVLILAFVLRIYGLNWDQGNHLHPDERFLTMVASAMSDTQRFCRCQSGNIRAALPVHVVVVVSPRAEIQMPRVDAIADATEMI